MRRRYVALLLLVASATAAPAQPHGAGLVVCSGRWMFMINPSTGDTVRALRHTPGQIAGPCFSPDGRKIAFAGYVSMYNYLIFTVDNDGGNLDTLCHRYTNERNPHLTWCTDGHIYWNENDNTGNIYRVNVETRQREIAYTFDLPAGGNESLPSIMKNISLCRDGTRAASMGNNSEGAYVYDLVSGFSTRLGAGCRGTLSPDGTLATHNTTNRGEYSFHQVCLIHDVDKALSGVTPNVVDSIVVPGAPNEDYRFTAHRFSHSSNDIVVYYGESTMSGNAYVCRVSTDEHWLLAEGVNGEKMVPYDFWDADLPSPQAGPRITLSPASLTFTSSGEVSPPARNVTVTNGGDGTLSAVTVVNVPQWLTVSGATDGNTQTLVNEVDVSGLPEGLHEATVTVSGGGAVNTVNYTVTLNVGADVAAPSGLTAAQAGGDGIRLQWVDNSDGETGFVVERHGGAAWQTIGTADADSTGYLDSPLAPGSYTYRVRAFAGADTSAPSGEANGVLLATQRITLLSPAGGESWQAGTTQYIRWTVENAGDIVVAYSVNDGETWTIICDNSVPAGSAEYGNYPWTVPAIHNDSVLVQLYEYGNAELSATSEYFTITGDAAVRWDARNQVSVTPSRLHGPSIGAAVLNVSGPRSGQARTVRVYGIDGSVRTRCMNFRTADMPTLRGTLERLATGYHIIIIN
ncbi:MAG: hypothetical protein GF331_22900 [Chitinivibrionales bacterium]|nr:hypothetical protein [Chitinivibrionales bacterium]